MPQIKEYQQTVLADANSPHQRVYPDAFEAFPHNAGAGFNALADVVQSENEKDDVANVHTMMAKARADWTTHLNDTYNHVQTNITLDQPTVDDNAVGSAGPTVKVGDFANKYLGDLSNYLSEAQQKVTTRAGARTFGALAAGLQGDMQEKAFAAQAHLTGLKAVGDYNSALNQYRNTLLNDPSQFQSILKEAEGGLGSWVDIPAADRIKLMDQTSEKLALSAVQGLVRQDPETAMKQLNDGQWDTYLTGNAKYMALHQAQLGLNAQQAELARQARAQDAMEKRVRTQVNDGFMEKWVGGSLTMKDVMDSSLLPFGEGSKDTWLKMIEKDNAAGLRPVKTDPQWAQEVFQRIHLPEGDPNKIASEDLLNQGYINGRVNRTDMDWLRKEVQADRTPDGQRLNEVKANFFKMTQKQIDSSTLMKNDPVGAEQSFKYQMFVEQLVEDARKRGENPYDLFNPKSKSYAGQYISQFQRSLQEQVEGIQSGIENKPGEQSTLPDGDKRKVGETPEQWRKRTGR